MDLKAPLTFDEQIEKLKSHGVIISDEVAAKKVLSEINYYRYTGYALQYRKQPNKSDYVDNLSFETVYRIYQFDECMRSILRKYIERVEVYYRTQISYGFSIAKCVPPPHDQHYDENNFYDKVGYNEVMDNLKKEKNYYKDSLIVKHHQLKYNSRMPLWVIVELLSLSNISKLYSSMYLSEKDRIATAMGISQITLKNHLHCLSVLRNKCAHAARLYNTQFNPPAKFTKSFLIKNRQIKNDSLFAYIVVLLRRLPEQKMKLELVDDLKMVIDEFKNDIELSRIGFPSNYLRVLINNCK